MTAFVLWMCIGNPDYCIFQQIARFSDFQTCNDQAIELMAVAEENGKEVEFYCTEERKVIL